MDNIDEVICSNLVSSTVVQRIQTTSRRQRTTTAPLLLPSIVLLFIWMAVPLGITLYFSVEHYNLLSEHGPKFTGGQNYVYLLRDPAFGDAVINSLVLLASVLAVTVVGGTLLAWLYDQEFPGAKIARLLLIAPFFVMPTVNALLWKNLLLHPIYGFLAFPLRWLHIGPIDWFGRFPMLAIIIILSWQWLPFAFLILLTSVHSLDPEQKEAALLEGAGPWTIFWHLVLPHLRRAISVVVMVEAIFLLSTFAEILITTAGGPGTATTNLTFLVYSLGLLQFDIGLASAGGVVAVLLANIVALFLIRTASRNLHETHTVHP
jgi:sorbitol/mannitol transport system permease protein